MASVTLDVYTLGRVKLISLIVSVFGAGDGGAVIAGICAFR
jgi:hypothetical protein